MTAVPFTDIRRASGRRCMHCNKAARTRAVRVTVAGHRLEVHYCRDHADLIIGRAK